MRFAEEAVRTAARMILSWLPGTYSALGWMLAWTGRTDAALSYLERSVSVHETLGISAYLSISAAGSPRPCAWPAGRLRPRRSPTARSSWPVASASGASRPRLVARGEIGETLAPADVHAADTRYRHAIDRARALGMRPVLARALLRRGQLQMRAGAPEQGRRWVAEATSMFREMDMRFWLGQADTSAHP